MKTLCLKVLVGTRLTKRQNEMKKHAGNLPSKETKKYQNGKIPRSKERKRRRADRYREKDTQTKTQRTRYIKRQCVR